MKYKVVTTCFGFRGRYWDEGTIIDIDPSENPPKHFVPLDKAPVPVKVEPHRTEPKEMRPGTKREVVGGIAASSDVVKLDRILTTDKVPNNVVPKVKLTRQRRAKKVLDLRQD